MVVVTASQIPDTRQGEFFVILPIISVDFILVRDKLLRYRFRRRDGRAAEGAPLLREYGVYSSIEGSNPSLSATSTVEC